MTFADTLFLGNVITVESESARAEAIAVKDGIISFVGSAEEAQQYCGPDTKTVDYGANTIYPGFMESHCHPIAAGMNLYEGFFALLQNCNSLKECTEVVRRFVDKYPGRSLYRGMGFEVTDELPTAAMLDEVVPDQAVGLTSFDGHSLWMNTKAMKQLGCDAAFAQQFGPELAPVDENGNPTGYLVEAPATQIAQRVKTDASDGILLLKSWEQFCFGMGFTAAYEAGAELATPNGVELYQAAAESKSLKLRTYAGCLLDEFCQDIPAAVEKIAQTKESCSSEYFKIIGIKTFADGVVENHTAYLTQPYDDEPTNDGTGRMVKPEALVQMYEAAAQHNLSVHVHAIGDKAVKVHLDALEAARENGFDISGIRPEFAHLELVEPADIKRFAELGVSAAVAPLWTPKGHEFPLEERFLGSERANNEYPIKSFVDAGANITFHTDFPVSPRIDVPRSIYTAAKRRRPEQDETFVRNANEVISRYEALCAMTKNVAYLWNEEDRLGTIEAGKIANFAVFDCNFLDDDIEDIPNASLINTIVDGDIVWPPAE